MLWPQLVKHHLAIIKPALSSPQAAKLLFQTNKPRCSQSRGKEGVLEKDLLSWNKATGLTWALPGLMNL